MPPWGSTWQRWYLRREFDDKKERSQKLKERGIGVARHMYFYDERKRVQVRLQRADPLIEWLKDRGPEQQIALNALQKARAKQVEARLLKLGWGLADIREGENHCDEWKPLVYSTKPLKDQDWKAMLPYLVDALESARGVRIKEELRSREWDRESIVSSWLYSLIDQLGPLDLTLHWKPSNDCLLRDLKDPSHPPFYPQGIERQDVSIHIPPMPPLLTWKESWSPELKELIEKDMPTKEFRLKFQKKQTWLKKQYFNWRHDLEASLVQTLPAWESLKPVVLQSSNPNFKLMVANGTGASVGPSNRLSLNLRRLLRADVRFSSTRRGCLWNGVHYADETIRNWTIDPSTFTYNILFSRITKAILHELQRPDASYLEMRALGKSFLCCRCTGNPVYRTWDDIVDHYAFENEWARIFYQAPIKEMSFPHCLDGKHEKPLVCLVAAQAQVLSSETQDVA
ncbi:unnamed protein product [Rhizoctonia solani]|uniref:Uncharacterized protein n=1 Tax=Rhizoctonia solani TaxID=456999 RepID=A0A8H3BZH8_9AGAM|nr:unnamed protein product [Rhizoctonia solani]